MDSRRKDRVAVTACREDELPVGGHLVLTLLGKSIGLYNLNGKIHALANRCPHKGAPVCLGRIRPQVSGDGPDKVCHENEGSILKCPWHQWEFEIETGRSVFDPRLRIATYETEISQGLVKVYLYDRNQDQSKTIPK
jgi:nitrite reductase/ring-hydroxylating ferredoxin subunit